MPHLKTSTGIDWNYSLDGEGEQLLFLHGWGVDGRIWRQQIKHFSKSYRVMSVDLPGHGGTSWQAAPFDQIAAGVRAVLDAEGFKRFSLIGSSFGGLVALKMYALNPIGIEKMVFVGSMPKFSKTPDHPYGIDLNQFRVLDGQLRTSFPSIINVFFRSLFTKEERATRRYKWLQKFRRMDAAPMREALWAYLDILEKTDLRDVLLNVSVPVQFISGEEDTICCRDTIECLRGALPQARFDAFPKCGHFPFLSKPYEFNEILEQFLKNGAAS